MKAGLITFHYANHYGAQLQAYALNKTIGLLGIPCELIDYVRPDTIAGNRLFKRRFSPRSILSNIHTLLHYKAFKRRAQRFSAFVKSRMILGEGHYSTLDALLENAPAYDLYLCGSDQIWNPLIFTPRGFDPAFFMPFAENKKKIAYAPSFGIAEIPVDKQEELINYLNTFSFLSVRESQGAQIIYALTGKEAEVVLDPTLLLSKTEWQALCMKPRTKEPYILCYFVSDPTPFLRTIALIQETLKLPVITLCGSRNSIPGSISKVYDAGPEEFLDLFQNAAFVCTNSFHGTVFSVLFEKDFFSFKTGHVENGDVNSRLYTILKTLGLTDRLLTDGTPDLAESDIGEKIDYETVADSLESERKRSLDYLKKALLN